MALLDKMRSMIAPGSATADDIEADSFDNTELDEFETDPSDEEYKRNRSKNLRLVENSNSDASVAEQTNYEQSARSTYTAGVAGKVHTRGIKGATVSPRDDLNLEPASQYSVSESVSLVNLADIRALQSKIHDNNAANANSTNNYGNNSDSHSFDANMTAEFDKVISIDPLIDDGTPRRIQVISPRRFNDMSALSQALKSNKIVVLKIARLDHQLAVRLLDFAFGATAALSGHTQKNEHDEFIFYLGSKITPDEQAALAEKGISLI